MGEEGRESFGPYRIVRRLGVGGMAETFEAVRVDSSGCEQRVCLKRILGAFHRDPAFVGRFEREALLAARLRHSNVVGVLDFGTEGGTPYMALELVDGPDLRAFLEGRPGRRLPVAMALLIASDLAMALAYAHAAEAGAPGLVHRDVSPSNVLLGRSGDVKLADFGIAKAMGGPGVTASGGVQGKIPYMSPEHMRGGLVDGRADLFSLGVVLFEMLAGARPFDGAHDVETMTHIMAGERARLEDLVPQIPTEVVAIIDRLLESRPEDRFADADALLDALESAGVDARERRALSMAVEAMLGGVETRGHLTTRPAPTPPPALGGITVDLDLAALEEPAEETTLVPASAPSVDRRQLESKRAVLFAFALGAIALVASVALRSTSSKPSGPSALGRAPAREAVATSRPEEPAAPAPRSSSTASGSRRSAASRRPSARPSPEPASGSPIATAPKGGDGRRAESRDALPPESESAGRLRVTVVPWGRIWVDGRARGRAPRTLLLAPGAHLVQVGFERPMASRRVRVRESRVSRVEFELE